TAEKLEDYRRQDLAEAGGRDRDARVQGLSLEPGRRQKSQRRYLFHRYRRLRPDGSRWPDLDQEPYRSDTDLPPLLPRGRLRLPRHEHRRPEHAGLHQVDARREGWRGEDQSAAASARGEGPGAGPHQFLRPICLDRAVAEDHHADAAKGMAAEPRGPRKTRRPL